MKPGVTFLLLHCAGAAVSSSAAAAALEPFLAPAATDRQPSSAGIDWLADDFRLRSGLTVRTDGDRTYIAPQLVSTYEIAPKLNVETRFDLAEWNTHSALLDSTVEVKFRLDAGLRLVNAVEGRVWRAPDGFQRSSLHLAVAEELVPGDIAHRPLTLTARVTLEQAGADGRPASISRGLQATLAGFGETGAENRLAINYRAESGPVEQRGGSISFGRSWPLNAFTQMTLNCELVDADANRGHQLALSWHGEF